MSRDMNSTDENLIWDDCVCVRACVSFFSGQHDNNELLPNSQHKKQLFKHEASKLKCFTFDSMQRYVFECCETPRKFLFFFSSIIYFDTMQ